MREILFRGKRVDNGEWVYGYYFEQNVYENINDNLEDVKKPFILEFTHEDYDYEHRFEVIPETIGQYTGLKDKNGKKIFEGDILRYREKLSDGTFEDGYDTVFYNEQYGTFYIRINNKEDNTEILGVYVSDINPEYVDYEVIGNIFNKEGNDD